MVFMLLSTFQIDRKSERSHAVLLLKGKKKLIEERKMLKNCIMKNKLKPILMTP